MFFRKLHFWLSGDSSESIFSADVLGADLVWFVLTTRAVRRYMVLFIVLYVLRCFSETLKPALSRACKKRSVWGFTSRPEIRTRLWFDGGACLHRASYSGLAFNDKIRGKFVITMRAKTSRPKQAFLVGQPRT
jgi:hypothetical protein